MSDDGDAKRQAYLDEKVTFIMCGHKCEHDFKGWRDFPGGGEQVCTKCGMGALEYSLWMGL